MGFIELTKEAYDAFASTHKQANFLNSVYATKRLEDQGWKISFVAMKESNDIVAAAMLASCKVRGGQYYYAPRGFLLDYHNEAVTIAFVKKIKTYLKQHGCLYLKIDPYVPYQEHDMNGNLVKGGFHHDDILQTLKACGFEHQGFSKGYDANTQCRWMSIINLVGKSEEDVYNDMMPQRRRILKNAMKPGIHVRELQKDELSILCDIQQKTSERQGFHDMEVSYYEKMMDAYQEHACACLAYLNCEEYIAGIQELIQQEQAIISDTQEKLAQSPTSKKMQTRLTQCLDKLKAWEKEISEVEELRNQKDNLVPLSAAFFLLYGREVVYLSGGSYEELMQYRGSYAVQWYMIKRAIQEGYACYNFYGISGYFEKGQEGYGVFDFKRGFHAEVIELLGDFILPIKPLPYRFLQIVKRFIH